MAAREDTLGGARALGSRTLICVRQNKIGAFGAMGRAPAFESGPLCVGQKKVAVILFWHHFLTKLLCRDLYRLIKAETRISFGEIHSK